MVKPSSLDLALGIGGVALFLWLAIALANWDPFGSKQRLRDAATSATRQASVSDATTKAVDHYSQSTIVIRERANRAVDQIQSAPGADTPLNSDFRSVLCASGLCLDPDKPDHDGSDDVPR